MIRAVKYRIYPNKAQQELILKHFGCARFVYNYFLNYRRERYALGIKETYFNMQSKLTGLKKEHTFLSECNSQSFYLP